MINSCELVIREKNKMKYFNILKNIKYINQIRAHPKNLYQIFLQILAIFGCFLLKYYNHNW